LRADADTVYLRELGGEVLLFGCHAKRSDNLRFADFSQRLAEIFVSGDLNRHVRAPPARIRISPSSAISPSPFLIFRPRWAAPATQPMVAQPKMEGKLTKLFSLVHDDDSPK